MSQYDIMSMTIEELETMLQSVGEKKFRAKQIFEWIHQKRIFNYEQMTNISKALQHKLLENTILYEPKIIQKHISKIDGTIKYLFELYDSHIIESVLMKHEYGNTICISSQVGCRMGCSFCASTVDGLIRNLTAGEMLSQVYAIQNDTGTRISNIVIMGSGEPLEQLDITLKFIELVNHPSGQNLGQRHITVSTCGLVPRIYELAEHKLQITLAISLHASNDNVRRQTMPIANKYSIDDIIQACRYYIEKTNRRITFEYALIDGINDSKEQAYELANLLKGLLCHINLIPVNEIEEREYTHSNEKKVNEFSKILNSKGVQTTVRRKLGNDINAACGQLRRRFIHNRGE